MIFPNTDCARVARAADIAPDAYMCCPSCHEAATMSPRLFRGAEVAVCCMTALRLPKIVFKLPKTDKEVVDA